MPMALGGRKPDQAWLDHVDRHRRACASRLKHRPVGAVRRPAAARRGRTCAREPARRDLRRRADRQPRHQGERRHPRVHAQRGRRVPPDDRDGDARPERRVVRATASCSSPTARSSTRSAIRPPTRSSTRCASSASRPAHVEGHPQGSAREPDPVRAHRDRGDRRRLVHDRARSVLTATITSVFDDLFANIYKGTDAVVRAPEVLEQRLRFGRATERSRPRFSTW